MSKQKRPDTYKAEVPEAPKHSRKKKRKTPKKKKTPPQRYSCPFCETTFALKRRRRISFPFRCFYSYDSAEYWTCRTCGAKPWGYKELMEEDKWYPWRNMYRWVPEYCTFCQTSGYDCSSKYHYFRLWTNDDDEIYCDYCKFRGKVGGGKRR